ncbi:MAG TPA: PQQ-dependent sugar dehydrogenase [Nitrososphaeraceae archaeon]|nr:PQQ-dependent sugar dehydrogenase [Nitrososphaeraceae archaeon]
MISINVKASTWFLVILISVNFIPIGFTVHSVYGQASFSGAQPIINNPSLKADLVFQGLQNPTSMAFLGSNDILVLEKDQGTVQRIVNGNMLPQPVLHVNVATERERGMLGIAIAKPTTTANGTTARFVFLYYTENGAHLGNHVYRYELVDNKLVNPKLILELPATPGPFHNGGKILIGPDKNVYAVIGDLLYHRTQAQNTASGGPPDLTGGIIRVTQEGKPVANGPLGNTYPLNLYYAYGIRNSFGMDFDPVNGKLWDTENGPNYGDEINLVEPCFNSGWTQVQGIWTPKGEIGNENAGPLNLHPSNLVDFGGKGKYRAPEFIWFQTVAPTALKFLNSAKLGKQYQNDMFVGDYKNGNLYHFKLNQNRTGLVLSSSLADKIAYTPEDAKPVIFGTFNGGITDLQVGPDGYLYVLTFAGAIYKIVPVTSS